MKRYLILTILLGLFCSLIYLSSVYLVKAEYSFKQLAQKTEDLGELSTQNTGQQAELPVQLAEKQEAAAPVTVKNPENTAQNIPAPDIKTQQEQLADTTKTYTNAENTVQETPAQEQKPQGPPRISMDFENANLKDVLKIFCQQSGLNFIAGENIELRPVTLYLSNVAVEDALNSIIKANGLTYEKVEGSDVFIVTKAVPPKIKLDTKVFKLKYASAEDTTATDVEGNQITIKGIKATIQKLISQNGDLSVDARTNTFIITDVPESFPIIEQSIKNLDSQLPQILIEAKIVEISTSDLDQIGIAWSSLSGYNFGFKSPSRTYTSSRVTGDDHQDINITDNENTNEFEDELVDHPKEHTSSETVTTTSGLTSTLTRTITDTLSRTLTQSDIRSAILSADDFTLTLSLLLTNENADLISNPNIVASQGKEAKITVGQQFPIPQYAFNTDTSTWEVQGFEYKDIGILLRVIPFASQEDGTIAMDIHPEVSSIMGYSNFGGAGGARIPIISTREAITNVLIKDGDTLAIGGLITDRTDINEAKVPLLGDLPVVGYLFKHKENTKEKVNMIIFITPHILQDGKIPPGVGSEASIPVSIVDAPENVPQQIQPEDMAQGIEGTNTVKQPEKPTSYSFSHR